jgi:hypothetical protein
MYVAVVPNRNSPPAVLLRESFRKDGKVGNRTIANLSHWPQAKVDALRAALKGSTAVGAPLPQAFDIVRSRPHGHAAAVLGTLRRLRLDRLFDPHDDRNRDLVLAMIVARVLDPASKLATSRSLHPDTLASTLGELLHLDSLTEDELYQAMDWLLPQQSRIEKALAQRHLAEGALVLYDLTSTYFEGRHCPLGKLGHSRDDQKGKLQVVFGLMTNCRRLSDCGGGLRREHFRSPHCFRSGDQTTHTIRIATCDFGRRPRHDHQRTPARESQTSGRY